MKYRHKVYKLEFLFWSALNRFYWLDNVPTVDFTQKHLEALKRANKRVRGDCA